MKTCLTFLLAAVSVMSAAQGTTLEEYNYITIGYAQDVASGHDLKSGYRFKQISSDNVADPSGSISRMVTVREVWRDEVKTHPIALQIQVDRSDTKVTGYYCIPTADASKEVWSQWAIAMKAQYTAANYGFLFTALLTNTALLSRYFSMDYTLIKE